MMQPQQGNDLSTMMETEEEAYRAKKRSSSSRKQSSRTRVAKASAASGDERSSSRTKTAKQSASRNKREEETKGESLGSSSRTRTAERSTSRTKAGNEERASLSTDMTSDTEERRKHRKSSSSKRERHTSEGERESSRRSSTSKRTKPYSKEDSRRSQSSEDPESRHSKSSSKTKSSNSHKKSSRKHISSKLETPASIPRLVQEQEDEDGSEKEAVQDASVSHYVASRNQAAAPLPQADESMLRGGSITTCEVVKPPAFTTPAGLESKAMVASKKDRAASKAPATKSNSTADGGKKERVANKAPTKKSKSTSGKASRKKSQHLQEIDASANKKSHHDSKESKTTEAEDVQSDWGEPSFDPSFAATADRSAQDSSNNMSSITLSSYSSIRSFRKGGIQRGVSNWLHPHKAGAAAAKGNAAVSNHGEADDHDPHLELKKQVANPEAMAYPGAVPVTANAPPDRVQRILDRKFNQFEQQGEAFHDEEAGMHEESALPENVQEVVNEKMHHYEAKNRQAQSNDPLQKKMASYIASAVAAQTVQQNTADESSQTARPTAASTFAEWNYGNELRPVSAPPPNMLTNQLMDDQEFALSGIERKKSRLAAGLCSECGRTKTHEKIKYGPFQAFRRMEPLTTPGCVYKGYCLFCNNIFDLRRLLHEPYLREMDLDGTAATLHQEEAAAEFVATTDDGMVDTFKNRRIQVCLCVAILAVVAGAIGLIVTFVGNSSPEPGTSNDAQTETGPPTAAPGPLGWYQVGPDISEPVTSFGYKVSISSDGNRLAVASPLAIQSSGRADVFEYKNETDQWLNLGLPFVGDSDNDQTGFGIELSDDGNNVIIGYPGNDNGFVRVFRYSGSSWKQLGQTLVGETAGGWFGASVSINPDGSFVSVGAPYDTNEYGSEAGRVQVFSLNNATQWAQVGQDLVGRAALDHFGISLSISDAGDVIAVGAPKNDDKWQDGGQVHVFKVEEDDTGTLAWTEPLDDFKIFGESEGHEFGVVTVMNGLGDTVVSSSVVADSRDGIAGGGDIRAMFLEFLDNSAEERGYPGGIPAIPGTIGLGNSLGVDYDGTRVLAATLNYAGQAGRAMVYDIAGGAQWNALPSVQDFGGEKLGGDEWLSEGPSVSLSSVGEHFAIGYESIVVDSSQSSNGVPIVRVYNYGYGEGK